MFWCMTKLSSRDPHFPSRVRVDSVTIKTRDREIFFLIDQRKKQQSLDGYSPRRMIENARLHCGRSIAQSRYIVPREVLAIDRRSWHIKGNDYATFPRVTIWQKLIKTADKCQLCFCCITLVSHFIWNSFPEDLFNFFYHDYQIMLHLKCTNLANLCSSQPISS